MVLPVGNKQADSTLFESSSSLVSALCVVSNHPSWSCPGAIRFSYGYSECSKYVIKELHLIGRGRVGMVAERNTMASDEYQAPHALPPLGLADSRAPFFAGEKLPSTKTSSTLKMRVASSLQRKARHLSLSTSSSYHSLRCHKQVEELGYTSGRRLHLPPVLIT